MRAFAFLLIFVLGFAVYLVIVVFCYAVVLG